MCVSTGSVCPHVLPSKAVSPTVIAAVGGIPAGLGQGSGPHLPAHQSAPHSVHAPLLRGASAHPAAVLEPATATHRVGRSSDMCDKGPSIRPACAKEDLYQASPRPAILVDALSAHAAPIAYTIVSSADPRPTVPPDQAHPKTRKPAKTSGRVGTAVHTRCANALA